MVTEGVATERTLGDWSRGRGVESMLAQEEVRLALRAHREGRVGMRDSLLTLAVADAGVEGAAWADRCRRWLVSRRSDHLFAPFPTLSAALADPRVSAALGRVRQTFPPVRVRHLLLRADTLAGRYTGNEYTPVDLLDAIFGKARRRPVRFRGLGRDLPKVHGFTPRTSPTGDQAILVLMAVFLALAIGQPDERTRAA